MTDPKRTEEPQPELDKARTGSNPGSAGGDPDAAKKLTADEQMALYEKNLKENDWGHQPC